MRGEIAAAPVKRTAHRRKLNRMNAKIKENIPCKNFPIKYVLYGRPLSSKKIMLWQCTDRPPQPRRKEARAAVADESGAPCRHALPVDSSRIPAISAVARCSVMPKGDSSQASAAASRCSRPVKERSRRAIIKNSTKAQMFSTAIKEPVTASVKT